MINTAVKHIRRSPYQALTAIMIMTITFFVATILILLAYGSSTTLKYFETKPQLMAYLVKDGTQEDAERISKKLQSDPRVERVKIVTQEEALQIYKELSSSQPLISEFLSPKTLPISIDFSVADLKFTQELISELEKDPKIDEINFTASLGTGQSLEEAVDKLSNISKYLKIAGGVTLTFLILSSLLVLLVIIGMRISSRRDEIEILQLLGATSGFIRSPFIAEGVFYAVVGAFAGWLLASLLTLYLSPSLVAYFAGVPFLPKDLFGLLKLFGIILTGQILLALILGASGSFVAIKRYLKI